MSESLDGKSSNKGLSNVHRSAISLGHILGIPIGLDYSWFLIFALMTWSLATSYYPAQSTTDRDFACDAI